MRLITEDMRDATLCCYDIEGDSVRLIHRSEQAQGASFAVLQDYLFIVSASGLLLRVELARENARPEAMPFKGVEEISANGRHLLLWINDGELIKCDVHGGVLQRAPLPAQTLEINLGRDDTVWISGGEAVVGGHQVFWSTDLAEFKTIPWPASAVHLFGASDGVLWTINSREEVWKLHRLGEGNMPGCRQDAGCRNCMYRDLLHAQQLAVLEGGVMLLDESSTLHFRADFESKTSLHRWERVTRFAVS
jgi:hypothetical protein